MDQLISGHQDVRHTVEPHAHWLQASRRGRTRILFSSNTKSATENRAPCRNLFCNRRIVKRTIIVHSISLLWCNVVKGG
jgi:hypothetical protein